MLTMKIYIPFLKKTIEAKSVTEVQKLLRAKDKAIRTEKVLKKKANFAGVKEKRINKKRKTNK